MERKKISILFLSILLFNSFKQTQLTNQSTVKLKLLTNEKAIFNNAIIQIDQLLDTNRDTALATSLSSLCTNKQDCYSTTNLDLSDNKFKKIPINLINKWFYNLKQLNMSFNLIGNLTFDFECSQLERFDLSSNRLSAIESDTFHNLKILKYLNLANNQIESINPFAFSDDTRYLVELNLSNNLINDNSIEFLLFASLTNLKYLLMDNNKLTMLSHHLLFNLYKLEYLSLRANNLIAFELFKLNKNSLKTIDLSFNENLKFDLNKPSDEVAYTDQIAQEVTTDNQLEVINLNGVDLSSKTEQFLDLLFDKYKLLKHLNLSNSKIKTLWSLKWPDTIETIDLSFNDIKDDQFDCRQFMSSEQLTNKELKLKTIYLNNNQLTSFKKFIENCSPILNKFTSLKIDIRSNKFTSIDLMYSSPNTLNNKKSTFPSAKPELELKCKQSTNKSSLLLNGNPLVCDCEANNWWSNMGLSNDQNLFYANNEICLNIEDYKTLTCNSTSSTDDITDGMIEFKEIRNYLIAPVLVCPYRYSCSAKTCQCCGFRACDCSFNCPLSCKCTRDYAHTYDLVKCSNVSMSMIPNYLPISTTDLLLERNNLKKIQPFQFFGRFRLLNIDLSNNQIGFIEESSFNGLTQLRTLDISYNSLQILLGFEFKDLTQLERLNLENNQIQFISNLTFSYLIKLKYLNLKHNFLRHTLDYKLFFQFNHQLINLTVDLISHETSVYSNDLKNLLTNTTKDSDASKDYYYYSEYYDNSDSNQEYDTSTTKTNENQSLNVQTENLIENLLNSDKHKLNNLNKQLLTDCIIEKFKSFNENKDNKEIVLIRNFKRFKANCLKSININELDQENDETVDESRIGLFKKDTKYSALHLAKQGTQTQSFIILNYNTIIMGSLILIVILAIFSAMIAFLIVKLQRTKKNNLIKSENQTEYCKFKTFRRFLNHIRKKCTNLMHQKNENKVIYQQPVKKVRMYTHPPEDDESTTRFNYDIFIVYNKLDSDLVHNVIAPILRSKPYNFSVALQHTFYKTESTESTINSIKTTVTTTTDRSPSLTSSFYSLSCDSTSLQSDNSSLIKSSSLVLFVLSKNLFTESEYNLSVRTPKNKKLAILADDISTDIAESILKPKKILRGKFDLDQMTFNFYCANFNDEYDFMDELRCSQRTSENNSMSSVFIQKDEDIIGRNVKILNKRIQF